MRRDAALAQSSGVKVEFLSASEAGRAPHFRAAGARAILFSPEDGYFHRRWWRASSPPRRGRWG